MRVYGWSLEKSRKVLKAYRQFLTLKKEHEDWGATELSPSFWVDRMWHQHILDVNYYHDTMLLCGRVVGHNPDGALSGKAERDEATREALEKRYPNYDKEIWGIETSTDTSSEAGMRGDESNEGNDRSEPKDDTINNDTTINDNTTNSDTITIRVKDQSSKAAKMTTVLDAYALRKGVLVSEVCVVQASVSCGMLKE